MPPYVAHVTTTTPTATTDQLDTLVAALAPHAGVPSLHAGRLSVHLDVDAPAPAPAVDHALALVHTALRAAGLGDTAGPLDVAAVEVLTLAEQERRLDLPAPPHDLVSTAQAATLLGVSRQRVLQLAEQHDHFPEPVRLGGRGLYWSRSALRRFEAVWRHGQHPSPTPAAQEAP